MSVFNLDNQPQPLWPPGQSGSMMLINNDTTNTVYVDSTRSVSTSSVPIPPQGSVTVDGTVQWWGTTASPAVVQLIVVPGGTQWTNPVGVRIALDALGLATAAGQIAQETQIPAQMLHSGQGVTTELAAILASGSPAGTPGGTPAIAFHRQILFTGFNIAVPVGTPYVQTLTGVTGTGYDGGVVVYAAAAAFCSVDMSWQDQSTGQELAHEQWWIVPGKSAAPQVVELRGPTEGNQLEITITAYTAGITISAGFFQNSRAYTRHDWRSTGWTQSFNAGANITTAPGVIPAVIMPSLVLAKIPSVSIAAATTNFYMLPLFAGRVRLLGFTASKTTDLRIVIFDYADNQSVTGADLIVSAESDANGNVFVECSLPRSQCVLQVTNNNAGAQNVIIGMVTEEY